jgi:hypothetical protein
LLDTFRNRRAINGEQRGTNDHIFRIGRSTCIENIKIGTEKFRQILESRTGISNMKHHRFVPLRISANCEDVGFQYLQSVKALEAMYPQTFDYTALPINDTDLLEETSSVFTTVNSKHPDHADRFAKFMLSDVAQNILRGFDLQK